MSEKASVETNKELSTATDLTDFKSIEALEAWGNKIVASKLTPLKEGADVVVAVLFGRELGFSPMVSVSNIYPINGKGTLGVHLINALLVKAGIVTEVIRDYEPCVAFAIKGEDGKAALYNAAGELVKRNSDGTSPKSDDGSPIGFPQVTREGFADEAPRDNEVKATKIINYKTILKLTRLVKQPNSTFKEMVAYGEYSVAEATRAGLMTRDSWKNWTKQMCYSRALAFGGRKIGPDLMVGMYETSEMADATGVDYVVEDGGKVTISQKNPKKSPNLESTESVIAVNEGSAETVETDKNPSEN